MEPPSIARTLADNLFERFGNPPDIALAKEELIALLSVAVVKVARAPAAPQPEPLCVVHYWTNSVGAVQSLAHPTAESAMRDWRPGVGLGAFEARYDLDADAYNSRHDRLTHLDPGRRGGATRLPLPQNPAAAGESRTP